MNKRNGDIISFLKQKDYIMVNDNLGKGAFAKTVVLQDPFIKELFVAKMYKPDSTWIKKEFYENFLEEIKILYKLNHKNVVRIYNYYAYEKEFTGYILMEYIEGKNIEEYFENYDGLWDEVTLNELFTQLIDGFAYIEEQGIIHRDIREGNILIDKNGVAKIIDFGIGKRFNGLSDCDDSLVDIVNRNNSNTLPQEFYDGIYTSQTDMFYLAELYDRMLKKIKDTEKISFSYFDILEKMMKKHAKDRYENFSEIKDLIIKTDFNNLNIADEDRDIYLSFTNSLLNCLVCYYDEMKFNKDTNIFISKLEQALNNNLFEYYVQKNSDIISSVVIGKYKFNNSKSVILCDDVRNFLRWFKTLSEKSKKLVLSNIIYKMSTIKVEYYVEDLPFI